MNPNGLVAAAAMTSHTQAWAQRLSASTAPRWEG